MKGWVYIISNKAMPGLVKVGFTMKDPEMRAAELNNTGSPHPYVVDYEVLVEDPRSLERKLHTTLLDKREGKEWFRASPESVAATIKSTIGNEIQLENFKHVDRVKSEAIARQNQNVRTARLADNKHKQERNQYLSKKRADLLSSQQTQLKSVVTPENFWGTFLLVGFVVVIALELLLGTGAQGLWILGAILSLIITPFVNGYLTGKEKEKPEYRALVAKHRNEISELDNEIAKLQN